MRPRGKQLSRHRFCQQRPNLGSRGFCLGERRKEFKKSGEVVDNSRYLFLFFLGGGGESDIGFENKYLSFFGWDDLFCVDSDKKNASLPYVYSNPSIRQEKGKHQLLGGGVQQKLFWGVGVQHVMQYTDWFS